MEERLLNLRKKVLEKIKEATVVAENGNATVLANNVKFLTEVDRLEKRLDEIEAAIDTLEKVFECQKDNSATYAPGDIESVNRTIPAGIESDPTRRRKAEGKREFFLRSLLERKGINLERGRSKRLFKTASEVPVGITFSSENSPGKWFLGLPTGLYDIAILLCEKDGRLLSFVLPKEFLDANANKLSQDKQQGETKYNIYSKSGDYFLQVPESADLCISRFLDNYEPLR